MGRREAGKARRAGSSHGGLSGRLTKPLASCHLLVMGRVCWRSQAAITATQACNTPSHGRSFVTEVTAWGAPGLGRDVVLGCILSLRGPAKEGLPSGTRGFLEHPGVSIPGEQEGNRGGTQLGCLSGPGVEETPIVPHTPLARTHDIAVPNSVGCWEVSSLTARDAGNCSSLQHRMLGSIAPNSMGCWEL